jgi:hypothetical protein
MCNVEQNYRELMRLTCQTSHRVTNCEIFLYKGTRKWVGNVSANYKIRLKIN